MSDQSNQQQPQPRYMPSIFKECDKYKQDYDKCFTNFFNKYVNNSDYKYEVSENPCQHLHTIYRDCLVENLELHKPYDINLNELKKDLLENFNNGEEEKKQN